MARPAARVRVPGSERPRPSSHKPLGPLAEDERLGVTLVVRPAPGSPSLPTLEDWQKTPLRERRYLTPEAYAKRHGSAAADISAVEAFARGHGLQVSESHAGRRTVTVVGTVGQMNSAFGVTLQRFEAPVPSAPRARRHGAHPGAESAEPPPQTHVHHGFDGAVTVPGELGAIIQAVVGLDDRRLSAPAGGTGDPSGAALIEVPTIAGWYNFPNTGATDQVIGVFAPNPAAYLQGDITNGYFPGLTNASYRTAPTLNDIDLTVGSTTFTNNASSVQAITSATPNATLNAVPDSYILELTQDVSTSSTIAQGCTVNVYFTTDSEQGWQVFLNRILQPQTEAQPTVVTASFVLAFEDSSIGSPTDTGSTAGVLSPLFQALAAQGIDVFIALGDWGADNRQTDGNIHVGYCSTDPWVTSCGGTVAVKSGSTLTEVVWSDAFLGGTFGSSTSDFGATGGGVSAAFTTAPAYQTAIGVTGATDSGGTTHTGRGVPDVAGMVGYNPFTINAANPSPLSYNFVGTSCVAPLYAGLAAVLRSAFGRAIGPFNTTLYSLASSAFNDVTSGNNDSGDSPDSPFFTAGVGWDACTGLGSIDGTKLLNGIASELYSPNWYFQVSKGDFGLDEVAITTTFSNILWLVLEGFTPAAVTAAGLTPTVSVPLGGITVTVGAAQPELASQTSTPQRILFPCTVAFDASKAKSVAQGGIFPDPGDAATQIPITSIISFASQLLTATTVFDLEAGADPGFANYATSGPPSVDTQANNPFWLSQDLRVFTVTPGINAAPIDGAVTLSVSDNTSYHTDQAYTYITQLLGHLNSTYSNPGGTDPFTLFPDQTNALSADSSVTPTQPNPANLGGPPFVNYNFAVARVRLTDATGATTPLPVKVFFRLFAAETSDTDYQPALTYPSNFSGGFPESPLPGVDDVTLPFFATGNYETAPVNKDYSGPSINNQTITVQSGNTVWAYYGCYLNIYGKDNTIGGKQIQKLLPSTHSCVVAQIAYDDAPIPTSGQVVGPENSDKLAQRNLQITFSDNPGPAEAHRIPQTFDLRRGPAPGPDPEAELVQRPDELMIDWGSVPAGSVASIYWPAVLAKDVLDVADSLYSTHQLLAEDTHTLKMVVPRGVTFVPIPSGAGDNLAGLFTVDLPQGVKAGENFVVSVRRITTRQGPPPPPPPPPPPQIQTPIAGSARAAAREASQSVNSAWRQVVGTFAVRIPVTTAKVMRPMEENTLAIMKWRLQQMDPTNRWLPVLKRYIGLVEGRVRGVYGDPGKIPPSEWGIWGEPRPTKPGHGPVRPPEPHPGRHHRHWGEHTGKIEGLVFDRFGDFEGLLLREADGEERFFASREAEIEELASFAWEERVRVSVITEGEDREEVARLVLRRRPGRLRRHEES
jgi:hypothetical protein